MLLFRCRFQMYIGDYRFDLNDFGRSIQVPDLLDKFVSSPCLLGQQLTAWGLVGI